MTLGDSPKLSGRRWTFGPCEYAEVSRRLTVNGGEVEIESKPLDVLVLLLEQPRDTLGKDFLLEMVWGNTAEQSLAVAISKLRRAFGGTRDAVIRTVSGVGYRMAVPVTCIAEEQSVEQKISLAEGEPLPRADEWLAHRRLVSSDTSPVWLAVHKDTGDQHVFKFAYDGLRLRSMQREVMVSKLFQREIPAGPHWAVPITAWNFENAPYYIESRYCGLNLSEWSATDSFQRMSFGQRVQLCIGLVEAVAAAHDLGTLHNDLKPSNILVEADAEDGQSTEEPRLRVSDFGAGSVLNRLRLAELDITEYEAVSLAESGSGARGSLSYQAPEVRSGGAATAQADVYALGLLAFQIVIGDLTRTLSPGWEATIPNELLASDIAAATQMDPALRLATAWELADRLRMLPDRVADRIRAEADRKQVAETRIAMERARIRRPWVVAATTILLAGTCISLLLYRRAVAEEKIALERSQTVTAMYDFLARDLIGQANPYLTAPVREPAPETLDYAIDASLPKIDARFSHSPEIAASLHETVADSFKGQTQYLKADAEYRASEKLFQAAQGETSEQAAIVEFKRENAELSGRLPGAVKDAMSAFEREKTATASIKFPSFSLKAWQAMLAASIAGLGPHPEQAVPALADAIRAGESKGDVDRALLIAMKARICGLYVRMGDGAKLEKAARDVSAEMMREYGTESPYLPVFQMYLQEALYLQGRYKDALVQADHNLLHFQRVLGAHHELTLAVLGNRAASESQLGAYAQAANDDVLLYEAEADNPSGVRLRVASLADAARNHCRSSNYAAGIREARRVIDEQRITKQPQADLATAAKLFLAECLVEKAEHESPVTRSSEIGQAESLVRSEDVATIDVPGSDINFRGLGNLTLARASMLRGDSVEAKLSAAAAAAAFGDGGADQYERSVLARINAKP